MAEAIQEASTSSSAPSLTTDFQDLLGYTEPLNTTYFSVLHLYAFKYFCLDILGCYYAYYISNSDNTLYIFMAFESNSEKLSTTKSLLYQL
jgi:hypothetical protein